MLLWTMRNNFIEASDVIMGRVIDEYESGLRHDTAPPVRKT